MTIGLERIRALLDAERFTDLLIELGWDYPVRPAPTAEGPESGCGAMQIAHKRGVGVWLVTGGIPDTAAARRGIEREVSRQSSERLLIFTDGQRQLWLWPEQRPSGYVRPVEHEHHPGSRNDALLQRLRTASFSMDEEGTLTVLDVLGRVRRTFSAEKVTKPFFKEFHRQREALLSRIEGIHNEADRSWYCSVLLNRLMFVYFLQRKGVLDGDPAYLRSRLSRTRDRFGEDGFFGEFLLPLFYDGLGSHLQTYDNPEIADLVGNVPYVNGDVFQRHELEQAYEIDIPDGALAEILDFFDKYRWHLDERPTDEANEINPDVLGYIFEQYVNQKEQGAYYTKEDITGYMASVTVIPAFLDRLGAQGGDDPCLLLSLEPDRYIHEVLRHGIEEPDTDGVMPPTAADPTDPLPPAGPTPDEPAMFEKAPPSWGLPGESWWEVQDRHRHYRNLRARLERDEIRDIDAAVTANLDLRRLADDYLCTLGSLLEVERAYGTLTEITVLDPTCGSGAFLFAALDVLYDLYCALFDRADELATEEQRPAFLDEAAKHPNRAYFILKTAMLKNLYGVDIMHEAGEIARLRLFLKLAAQLREGDRIEPLPDLDFNIKTGNLLVGIAGEADVEKRLGTNLAGLSKKDEIDQALRRLALRYERFVGQQQQADDPAAISESKTRLNEQLSALRNDLDRFLHGARVESMDFDEWQRSHQPFHWEAEFPQVFSRGGFDVVIGNPPYIASNKVTSYVWRGYETDGLPDICAPCMERSLHLARPGGRFAMILPLSVQFSDRFAKAREVASSMLDQRWVSTFGLIPAALFSGQASVRNTILAGGRMSSRSEISTSQSGSTFVTRFHRWIAEFRPALFPTLRYTAIPPQLERTAGWIRLGSAREAKLLAKLVAEDKTIGNLISAPRQRATDELLFKQTASRYYLSLFLTAPPVFDASGKEIKHTKVSKLQFVDIQFRNAAFVLSLSKLGLLWWMATSDEFDVTKSGLCSTPIPSDPTVLAAAASFATDLQDALEENITFYRNANKWMGNYDVRKVRHLTDQIDRLVLESLELEDCWLDLQLFYATFMKQTREAHESRRELPEFS